MIRAVVTGAMGRMGQRIIHGIQEEDGICLAGALERPGHPDAGGDAGELSGIRKMDLPLSTELSSVLDDCDVVIDFTFPEVTTTFIIESSGYELILNEVPSTVVVTPSDSIEKGLCSFRVTLKYASPTRTTFLLFAPKFSEKVNWLSGARRTKITTRQKVR